MKMKTPGAAVLLLLCSALVVVVAESGGLQDQATDVDSASTQQTSKSDLQSVLREMSALIAEQKVELRYTKTQMVALGKKAETLEARLRASENKAETLESRLRASEGTVEEQRAVIKELKGKQEEQAAAVSAVGDNVTLMGSQVEDLRREREASRVSFSASLLATGAENFGPFKDAKTLVFRNKFINIGSAYNPNTGFFTAPVRGVYHFLIFAFGGGHADRLTAVYLQKNGQQVVIATTQQPSGLAGVSNAASLLLEVGDVVNVNLYPQAWVHDSYNHHTTFSGHLLFTM